MDEKALRYSIQLHEASHRHFDLRLQNGSVLKSWAIPKEPSEKEGERRLAVMTEDHPLDYWNFEGKIEEGQYGAGIVRLWDWGTYEIVNKQEGKWIIDIKGKRLKGVFVLLKMKSDEEDRNWLFFRKRGTSK